MRPLTKVTKQTFARLWLWVAIASSSIVYVEPAPCDALMASLLVYSVAFGLRVPAGVGAGAILLGVFLLGNSTASMFAPDPSVSVRVLGIRTYLIVAWWFLLTALVYESSIRVAALIYNAYLYASLVAAGAGILAVVGWLPDVGQLVDTGRVQGYFKDPNVYGPFLVPAMIYLLFRLEGSRLLQVAIGIAPLLLLFGGLLLSYSRGAWLNFAVSTGVYLFLRARSSSNSAQRKRAGRAALVVAFVGILGLSVILGDESTRNMFQKRMSWVQEYDFVSEVGGKKSRFDAQIATLRLVMQYPAGIGAGQSGQDYFQNRAPHNTYLHVLVEGGWAGGLAFIAFLLLTLWRSSGGIRGSSEAHAYRQIAFSCLVGLLVQSFFIDSTHWRHLYFLLGMLWGLTLAETRVIAQHRDLNSVSRQLAG